MIQYFTRHALPSLLSVFLASALVAPSAHADRVHTDTSRVHACLPLSDASGSASVLAATDGGLLVVDGTGHTRAVKTALDGLAGTRSHTLLREGDTVWLGGEEGLTQLAWGAQGGRVVATFASRPVRAIARHGGDLYIGTWGAGVKRLTSSGLKDLKLEGETHASASRITALATHRGQLIAATAGRGLLTVAGSRARPLALRGLQRAMVWSLLVHDETLLVGTVEGLFSVEELKGRPQQLAVGDVRGLSRRADRILAATFGQGLQRLDDGGLSPWPLAERTARFTYAHATASGLSCMATHDGLWVRADGDQKWRAVEHSALPSGDISALAVDGAKLWVGTFDAGLAVFENGRFRRVQHERIDPKINALAVADGKLWIGTSAGLSVLEGDAVTRMDRRDGMPSSFVMALRPLRGGGVLVGTAQGAMVVRGQRIEVIGRKLGIYISNVWSVHEEDDGTLLLGTTKGLYRVRANNTWERFSVASGHLRDDWVMAIERDGDTWWVGTYKGGVTRFEPAAGAQGAMKEPGANAQTSDRRVNQLGGGFINPGGLSWHEGVLYAATMDGLLTGDGTSWQPVRRVTPGRDTTSVVHQAGDVGTATWIASRRGLRVR